MIYKRTFKKGTIHFFISYDMAVKAANEAYQQASLTAEDVSVVELHDCFSTNELIMYEALVSVCVCVCIFQKFA